MSVDQDNDAYRQGVADRLAARPMQTAAQFLADHPSADADDYPLYVAGYKADRDDLELVPEKGAGRSAIGDSMTADRELRVTITGDPALSAYHEEVRAKYKQADRDKMAKSGAAMSDGSYPIADAEDLSNAIHAVGRGGASHDAIRKHIIARAKALGLSSKIPDNWGADGSLTDANADADADDTEHRHGAFTGKHSHPHPAEGSQGDDETHDHEHSHDGDGDHGHSHPAARSVRTTPVQDELSEAAIHSLLAQRSGLHHVREVRYQPFTDAEVRMSKTGEPPTFVGYASIFDSPYTVTDHLGEYSETVTRGAFDKTISQGADVVFLINHDGSPLARSKSGTLSLRTDKKGLQVEARLDPNNPRVTELRSMVERGDLDEMSFAFKCLQQDWNSDYTERALREVSLHHGDVSAVNFGANGATKGSLAMRAAQHGLQVIGFEPIVGLFREWRAGAQLSGAAQATLKHVLSLASTSDTAVDELQVVLSEFLGVKNPDIAQDAAMERSSYQTDEQRASHAPMTGKHSHQHASYGQGNSAAHTHLHSHSNDANHDHASDGTANGDAATDSQDQPNADAPTTTLSAFEDYEYRIRIAKLRGAA